MQKKDGTDQLKKIVLVTSGQPSANPRMVKEAKSLSHAGFEVTVIYCLLSPWADEFDKVLFAETPGIRWIKKGFHSLQQPSGYLFARLRKKIFHSLSELLPGSAWIAIQSMVFYSRELKKETQKHKADIYIGHNLGALPAITAAVRRNGGKAIFDFEDFHRGEDIKGSEHSRKVKLVEDYFVPFLHSATASSPLIKAAYEELYPSLEIKAIRNCFPLSYATAFKKLAPQPLKLFWFSQFIGKNRGLETVIKALGLLKDQNITISLLGNCSDEHQQYFTGLAAKCGVAVSQLHFLPPVSEKEIVSIAAQHHIGIAGEVTATYNRHICLTNKIFTYLLAGTAVLFSDTRAQQDFLKRYENAGQLYGEKNERELAACIDAYAQNEALLLQHRFYAYQLAQAELNWDMEQQLFIKLIQTALQASN